MKIGFKSIMFLLAVGIILSLNLFTIPILLKMVLYFGAIAYIIKYSFDSYILYKVENPYFISDGVNKMHKEVIDKKNKKV